MAMSVAQAMTRLEAPGDQRVRARNRQHGAGESLGVCRDGPVPRGCASPFAPIGIGEMVRRQG